MKIQLAIILLVLVIATASCKKQPCDGTGPCNYPKYSDVPALSEKNKYCKYTVVKRISCSWGRYAFDCDDIVCVECEGNPCPADSTDAAQNKFLKIKYNKDDYVLKLGTPSCGVCTLEGVKHIYKEK